ncbi:hypothetical protein Ocin01_07606 [Orchesella cincta]|uniref:Uncharacterized protein n=1 Tax=Orchesella cincta TaxID=48709 RepID=A0A1D2N195_ORCCI|nr:hypothetical protein Ocin01_07606 [Orchesella cincta]
MGAQGNLFELMEKFLKREEQVEFMICVFHEKEKICIENEEVLNNIICQLRKEGLALSEKGRVHVHRALLRSAYGKGISWLGWDKIDEIYKVYKTFSEKWKPFRVKLFSAIQVVDKEEDMWEDVVPSWEALSAMQIEDWKIALKRMNETELIILYLRTAFECLKDEWDAAKGKWEEELDQCIAQAAAFINSHQKKQ